MNSICLLTIQKLNRLHQMHPYKVIHVLFYIMIELKRKLSLATFKAKAYVNNLLLI